MMWHTNIPNFEKVQYQDIYPGIDLVYHGTGGQLDDFVIHPGAQQFAFSSRAHRVGFSLGADDAKVPLVIDP